MRAEPRSSGETRLHECDKGTQGRECRPIDLIVADLMSFQDYVVWLYEDTEHFARAVRIVADRVMQNLSNMLDAVVVDLAAETGGNCEVTRAGETVVVHGVTVMGPLNLPATVPLHASQMFGRNVLTLLQHLAPGAELKLDLADEITGPMAVTHAGAVRFGSS
jgi:hypothetical protein